MEPKKPENVVQEAFYKFVNQSIAAVPAVSGVVKSFITKAAHGARLLCNPGRWNHGVSLLDFNSLCPFALSQLEIPTSAPTVWNDSMNLHSYRYYILDIDITSLKDCPFYSYIKPGRRIADRFEIEDISKYCGAKYRIIRGYVFGGPVVKVSQFIEELAAKKQSAVGDERDEYKKALNCIYGKCLAKGYKTEWRQYFDSTEEFQKYISKHWARVERFNARKREVWLDECLNNTFNYAQIGVMILSMSKRIMNELFVECQAKGIDVLLHNTDSILIPSDKVELLRHRIGSKLGQLHLEMAGDEAIIVRPNCYYISDNHYRAAGVPHAKIEATGDIKKWFIKQL
jgi:hypothetical protein